jgi:outer membrane protein assembly factor BamA
MLAVLLPFTGAAAQTDTGYSIVILGNKRVSTQEILAWLKADSLRGWDERTASRVAHAVREGYAEKGYPFCLINSITHTISSAGEPELVITLDEGEQVMLASVEIVGIDSIGNKSVQREKNIAFTRSTLEAIIERFLSNCESAGFPFAAVRVSDIRFTPSEEGMQAHVTLLVEPGERLLVKHIRVEGNSVTREDVIVREAGLGDGTLFQPGLVERIRRRIERMQLFSRVHEPQLFVTDERQGGILIRVEEGNQNRFDGVVGYVPAGRQTDRGFVMGLVDVQLGNLFGTARRFSVRWYREDRLTQEVGIRYFEPWVASRPLNGEIGFNQRRQDSIYVRQSLELRTDMRLGDAVTVGGSFSDTRVYPGEGRGGVRRSRLTAFGGLLRYDNRENPITPTDGALYATEVQIGTKTAHGVPTELTRRIALDLEYYQSIFPRQVLVTLLHVREFRSASLQVSDLYRLGGATTLRGYRESQFLGSRVAWLNVEYRFLTGGRSFAYGFVDAGYVSSVGLAGASPDRQMVGYGVGFRLETGLGLIGVNLALGEGDTFGTMKLHFRLINEF